MENNKNYFVKETIIPDEEILMAIKTEPEVIIDDKPGIQSVIPSKSYSGINATDEMILESHSSEIRKTEDILSTLQVLSMRLQKIEENQTNILRIQSALSNGQAAIVNNQQQIVSTIEKIEKNIVSKDEMLAQAKLLTECKTAIKRVESSVCCLPDDIYYKNIVEITSMFPLRTLSAVLDIEEKLESSDFELAMITYLNKTRGASEDVGSVIRAIFTDDLLEMYNWDGRWGKYGLGNLTLFSKTLRDVFQQQGALEFEKSIKKAIDKSHHRSKQKKYLRKENNKINAIK